MYFGLFDEKMNHSDNEQPLLLLAPLDQNGNEDSETLILTEFDAVQFCMKHTDQLHIIQGTCSIQWS